MKSRIRNHSKEFKFRVAVEMLKGDLSQSEISSKYGIAISLSSRWRKQLLDQGSEVFASSKSKVNKSITQGELDKLHAVIGRLKVENDFLEKASSRLSL